MGYNRFQTGWVYVEYDLLKPTFIHNCIYVNFRIIWTQFYINFSRQKQYIDVLYVSFNAWGSQVSSYNPFQFSCTVPLKGILFSQPQSFNCLLIDPELTNGKEISNYVMSNIYHQNHTRWDWFIYCAAQFTLSSVYIYCTTFYTWVKVDPVLEMSRSLQWYLQVYLCI